MFLTKNALKFFLVPFFTTMEASGSTLDATILTRRLKRFSRHLKIQNPSIIADFLTA